MNFFTNGFLAYYNLGKFVAHNMLDGKIHPDMQLNNIEERQHDQLAFVDFADMIEIDIPDCLSADICEQLTRSLLPIIEDIKSSFSMISSFRMGFIAHGGLLGHAIFSNTINLGISSALYVNSRFIPSTYDSAFLYSDESKTSIRNWKKIPFDQISTFSFPPYDTIKKQLHPTETNQYYLNILYCCLNYISSLLLANGVSFNTGIPMKDIPNSSLLLNSFKNANTYCMKNFASAALHQKYYYTAYGLLYQCLESKFADEKLTRECKEKISDITDSIPITSRIHNFIMKNLDLDLFEFMWILDDLEHIRPI